MWMLLILSSILETPVKETAQDTFWKALQAHCGKTFAAEVTLDSDARMAEPSLHVRIERCAARAMVLVLDEGRGAHTELRLVRTGSGLRLIVPESDKQPQMTADTFTIGQPTRQELDISDEPRARVPGSARFQWTLELTGAGTLVYRFLRDAATPVLEIVVDLGEAR